MIVAVMAITNLVSTQQIYSEETNSAHVHNRDCVPLSCNEYNKDWRNTHWLKHWIYLLYSSRNCFELFEYSEKRIGSIHKNFLLSLGFIGFLLEIGFHRL